MLVYVEERMGRFESIPLPFLRALPDPALDPALSLPLPPYALPYRKFGFKS